MYVGMTSLKSSKKEKEKERIMFLKKYSIYLCFILFASSYYIYVSFWGSLFCIVFNTDDKLNIAGALSVDS